MPFAPHPSCRGIDRVFGGRQAETAEQCPTDQGGLGAAPRYATWPAGTSTSGTDGKHQLAQPLVSAIYSSLTLRRPSNPPPTIVEQLSTKCERTTKVRGYALRRQIWS